MRYYTPCLLEAVPFRCLAAHPSPSSVQPLFPLSPFPATHTKNAPVSPFVATHTKTKDLKSFVCHTYKKPQGRGPEHQQKRIASSSMEHGLRRHVRPQQANVNHFFSCGSRKTENGLRFNHLFSHRNTVNGLRKRSATNLSSLADNGRRRTDHRSAIAPAPVTLLESILTKTASLSPLESILTKKPRGGADRPIEFLL